MKRLVALVFAAVATTAALADDQVSYVTPLNVMTGIAGSINDSVWLRATGQIAHANCYYAVLDVSLFYARTDSGGVADSMNANKMLAILLAAKAMGRTVSIQIANNSTEADFYGYGTTKCEIKRMVLD